MPAAFGWGAFAALPLLLGALLAYRFDIPPRVNAAVMAVGSGVLIGAVAFDLAEEALRTETWVVVSATLLAGATVFVIGARVIERRGGGNRKDPGGQQAEGQAEAIVLGSVLDGVPESVVLGLTVLQGGINPTLLIGVLLSNLPEGLASSSGLRAAGWRQARVLRMWGLVVLASAISAAAGYALLDDAVGGHGPGLAQAFAAGALLAMLADTMLPESYEEERTWTGILVVAGFALAIALGAL